MALDEIDKEILRGLLEDGRMSYRELGERTGVTPPTVKSRVDDLMGEGIIEGFTVEIDEEKLTEDSIINALVVLEADPSDLDDVYNAMKRCEGAVTIAKTADSQVVTRFKGSRDTFEKHLLDKMPTDVNSYRTMLVSEEETKGPAL